jgi:hypothetical protein
VKVDDQIEPCLAQSPGQPRVVNQASQAARALGHDDGVKVGVVTDHRFSRRLDEV